MISSAPWPLAAFLSSLPFDFAEAVRAAAELGFSHVDPVALAERPSAHLDALADSGLVVSCPALGRGLPDGVALDAENLDARRTAVALVQRQIIDSARLGATMAYLVPPVRCDATALAYFTEAVGILAEFAGQRMVRLCIEAFPGRALATAANTLDWLKCFGDNGPALLLDVGHCLISDENAATVVRSAGSRLGYVHLDDNDAQSDLHWPLLTGRLTETHLRELAAALREIKYPGGLGLELNPTASADPVAAMNRGRHIIDRCFQADAGETNE